MTDPLAAFRKRKETKQSSNDPRVQAGIDYVNANGGDPEIACKKLLNERGIPIPNNPATLAFQILSGQVKL